MRQLICGLSGLEFPFGRYLRVSLRNFHKVIKTGRSHDVAEITMYPITQIMAPNSYCIGGQCSGGLPGPRRAPIRGLVYQVSDRHTDGHWSIARQIFGLLQ